MEPALMILAAATETAAEVERWFDYPLLRLGEQTITVLTIAKIVFWVTAILVLNRVFQRIILRRLLNHTRLNPGLQFAIAKMFGYAVVVLGFYVALVANGVNLSSLAVVAGALGLGIGFGLQGIVANFVSGIVLLAERPVSVGDRIEVEGVAGRVTKIAMRATTVLTNDNIAIIVPNSQLTSNPVTNWSHGGTRVRLRLPVGVAYGTDPERVRAILLATAYRHPAVLKTPEATLFFDGFGDNALNFELAVWTDTMTHSPRRFRSELNFLIERSLRENAIEIPFPQRVVHVRTQEQDEAADLRVNGTRQPERRGPPDSMPRGDDD
ncbi:MAG TPA: mechanosensitive ion channel domain-containing protein [Opitutaceae bacterium]|nr:mechanosensitive ion channel domain-containing protein [Opitutaceae bacterium]